jgi:hypothetical protein
MHGIVVLTIGFRSIYHAAQKMVQAGRNGNVLEKVNVYV